MEIVKSTTYTLTDSEIRQAIRRYLIDELGTAVAPKETDIKIQGREQDNGFVRELSVSITIKEKS